MGQITNKMETKKNELIWFVLLIFVFSSCNSDDVGHISESQIQFTAGYANDNLSRTGIDVVSNVFWDPGDVINVNGKKSTKTTVFSGSSAASFSFDATILAPTYYAYYPAEKVSAFDDLAHMFEVTLPDSQTYRNDHSFSNSVNPAVAVSENTYLYFYNLCGMLRIPITTNGEAVKARFLSADHVVSGSAVVNPLDKNLTITGDGMYVDITALPSAGAYTLIWVLPAATYGAGWKIQLLSADGNVISQKTFVSELTIKRSYVAYVQSIYDFPKDETPTIGTESEIIYDYVDSDSEWSSYDIGF